MNEELDVEWASHNRWYHGRVLAFVGGEGIAKGVVEREDGAIVAVDLNVLSRHGSYAAIDAYSRFEVSQQWRQARGNGCCCAEEFGDNNLCPTHGDPRDTSVIS